MGSDLKSNGEAAREEETAEVDLDMISEGGGAAKSVRFATLEGIQV